MKIPAFLRLALPALVLGTILPSGCSRMPDNDTVKERVITDKELDLNEMKKR